MGNGRLILTAYGERGMKMKTKFLEGSLVLAACCMAGPPLWAQADSAAPKDVAASAPAFEVVSIKPDKSDHRGAIMQSLPDGFRWTNFPVVSLIQRAYGVSMENQIEGLPGWAKSDPYDFEAKADAKIVEDWKNLSYKERWKLEAPMMQSLLADRCQLKVHLVTREMPVYDLVIAKGGLKMKEAAQSEVDSESMSGNTMTAHAQTTDSIVAAFQGSVGRMIVDKTGLAGKRFNFELSWVSDNRVEATGEMGPSLLTALEEELGLKLVSAKGPVPVLIIDHIEKPSPN